MVSKARSDREFDDFFEEVWQLAELAAEPADWQFAPLLFELAEDIAWEKQHESGAADLPFNRPEPQPVDTALMFQHGTTLERPDLNSPRSRLDTMEAQLSRQQVLISRLERVGDQQCVELAYQMLALMQDSMALMRSALAASAAA